MSTLMSKNKSTPQTPLKLQCILKIKKNNNNNVNLQCLPVYPDVN